MINAMKKDVAECKVIIQKDRLGTFRELSDAESSLQKSSKKAYSQSPPKHSGQRMRSVEGQKSPAKEMVTNSFKRKNKNNLDMPK